MFESYLTLRNKGILNNAGYNEKFRSLFFDTLKDIAYWDKEDNTSIFSSIAKMSEANDFYKFIES